MRTLSKKERIKLVALGDLDHGKSTLIGRLMFDTNSIPNETLENIRTIAKELKKEFEFAFLTDQLQEEREEGLTISTSHTFLHAAKRRYVIIDAPGHVKYMKDMITGATKAEAAMLIVSAETGLTEQARRHAYFIHILGLRTVIALINKMDLVDYGQKRYEEIREELLHFLRRININPSEVIPISAKNGDNVVKRSNLIQWFKGPTLLDVMNSLMKEVKTDERPLSLPVQDIYRLKKGVLIVGRISSGILKKGQLVVLLPSKQKAEIKSIKFFTGEKNIAGEGENVGIILEPPLPVKRGDIIVGNPDNFKVRDSFKATLFWTAKEPLRIAEPTVLRCATQKTVCSIEKIDKRLNSITLEVMEKEGEKLLANETGEVTIRTKQPITIDNFNFIEELGRFVLEREGNIQGGGIITQIDV